MPAGDIYENGSLPALMKIRRHVNSLIKELELDTVEPETLCCVQKLHETWNEKCGLHEEMNSQGFKARGGDPTNNCFQVSANAVELEPAEVRKCNGCRDWRVRELPLGPLHITVRDRD